MDMSILDYSKIHMYSLYYNVVKPKYDDKSKLTYTDTDSYVINVETNNIYEDFKKINGHMDFSDYPPEQPNYDKSNMKVLEKMTNGKIITHFIRLKQKAYCYKAHGDARKVKEWPSILQATS